MYVLGISRHHDSAAALVSDGEVVEEERLNRRKHFGGFPSEAVRYRLREAGITLGDVDHVAYFWPRWAEVANGLRHFVRYWPGTMRALRPTAGPGAKGLLATVASDGLQRHYDD